MKQLINKIIRKIMTPKEQFEIWNKQGFEGDSFIEAEVKKLCDKHKITTIFETGSRYGYTTIKLAQFASVVSCELDKVNFNIAEQNIKNQVTGKNVAIIFNCDSVLALNANLKNCVNQRILLYLDAHGVKGTPLLQELEEIAKANIRPVIVIHDFKVPGREDLGFDTYNKQPYTWEWIESHICSIYPEGYVVHYNEQAEGAMRGVIYIEPAEVIKTRKVEIKEVIEENLEFNKKLDETSEKIIKKHERTKHKKAGNKPTE